MKRKCNLEHREKEEEKQQMTIFYNGRISVCDVTEIQAREIIMFASQEMEEKVKILLGSKAPSSSLLQSPVSSSPSTGLFMKRSLQRFLQKRRNRIQAISPY